MINVKDANGQWVCIKEDDLMLIDFKLFGYGVDQISSLIHLYEMQGGLREGNVANQVQEILQRKIG